jgi:aryl-phospho-beta-D-glucosidase BglC (GH1 family)
MNGRLARSCLLAAVLLLPSVPRAQPLPQGRLHTSGTQIVDDSGRPVRIMAVNWFGMNSSRGAPGDLQGVNWRATMRAMVNEGFNAIRLPISNALVEGKVAATDINLALNPDLTGLSGLALLDRIIGYARDIGLRVILDIHNSSAVDTPRANGLWYNVGYNQAHFLADWQLLATRYGTDPTVIGADLFNEPHDPSTWGDGNRQTDWALAATDAGNAVLRIAPGWLIIVDGIQRHHGTYTNWGGNLAGVLDHPITLAVPHQLVYSAHDYPASAVPEPYLDPKHYAATAPASWTAHWGFVMRRHIAPVFVGEVGSNEETAEDREWTRLFTSYLNTNTTGAKLPPGQVAMSFGWWSWNANPQGNPKGLLQPDEISVNAGQRAALRALMQRE